jgi:hypothetical protein
MAIYFKWRGWGVCGVPHGPGRAEGSDYGAEALSPLEGDAAFQRKVLIARASSTLVVVAISQGDNQYAREEAAKWENYARRIGDAGLVSRALPFSCIWRLSVGDSEGYLMTMIRRFSLRWSRN